MSTWTFQEQVASGQGKEKRPSGGIQGPVEFARERLGFFPDKKQEELLRAGIRSCRLRGLGPA